MLFSECTVVLFGRCNLLNSRQLSFINQVETVVKSYKEQIKLITLLMMVRRVEFLIPILLISRRRKLPLYVNDNYTHHKSWPFFLLRNSTLAICSIFDSFHEKPKETRKRFSRFGKRKIMIKCSVKRSQSLADQKTQKRLLNSVLMLMIDKVKESFLKEI